MFVFYPKHITNKMINNTTIKGNNIGLNTQNQLQLITPVNLSARNNMNNNPPKLIPPVLFETSVILHSSKLNSLVNLLSISSIFTDVLNISLSISFTFCLLK